MKKLFTTLFCGIILLFFSHHLFAQANQATFNYTGATEQFIVPANVFSLSITATGGSGGTGNMGNTIAPGGLGAEASAVFTVIPGDILTWLLYTSYAADDSVRVDLVGRLIF